MVVPSCVLPVPIAVYKRVYVKSGLKKGIRTQIFICAKANKKVIQRPQSCLFFFFFLIPRASSACAGET